MPALVQPRWIRILETTAKAGRHLRPLADALPAAVSPTIGARTMLTAIIFIVIGIFIGWNVAQPPWAKSLQDKAVAGVRGLISKTSTKNGP